MNVRYCLWLYALSTAETSDHISRSSRSEETKSAANELAALLVVWALPIFGEVVARAICALLLTGGALSHPTHLPALNKALVGFVSQNLVSAATNLASSSPFSRLTVEVPFPPLRCRVGRLIHAQQICLSRWARIMEAGPLSENARAAHACAKSR